MSGRTVLVSWLCAAGGLLFAVVTTLVGESQGAPTRFLFFDGTVGLLFILAGLVAWSVRPEVRTGPLLLASGVLWFVGSYAPTMLMPASWLGFSFERYYDVLLAFLALTFPDVRLRGLQRVVRWSSQAPTSCEPRFGCSSAALHGRAPVRAVHE